MYACGLLRNCRLIRGEKGGMGSVDIINFRIWDGIGNLMNQLIGYI